jgi:hypothetical protein
MRILLVACSVLAGCGVRPAAPAVPLSARWVPVEAPASRLDYPAGDGAVTDAAKVLVLLPVSPSDRGRRPPPELVMPDRVEVGEIFRVGVRVERAGEKDVRTFRLRCGRPGLRLLDGDVAVVVGRRVTERRAVADSPGPARFELDEIGN